MIYIIYFILTINFLFPFDHSFNQKSIENLKNYIDNNDLFANDGSSYFSSSFVRIDSFADSSIDMLVQCFTKAAEWDEFLKVKEKLAIQVKEIIENEKVIWSGCYELDEIGSGENSAMAKLVSITLSAGIDLILDYKLKAGVQAAPSDKNIIEYFFKILKKHNISIHKRQ